MAVANTIREHWNLVGVLPCMVSGRRPITLHHAHGGSLLEVGVHKGIGQKTSDWLVIPLAPDFHSVGPYAIDGQMGVKTWEARFGTQVKYLDELCRILNYNVWYRAGITRTVEGLCLS